MSRARSATASPPAPCGSPRWSTSRRRLHRRADQGVHGHVRLRHRRHRHVQRHHCHPGVDHRHPGRSFVLGGGESAGRRPCQRVVGVGAADVHHPAGDDRRPFDRARSPSRTRVVLALRQLHSDQGRQWPGRLHRRDRPSLSGELLARLLTGGPTTTGTLNVTTAQAVAPATPIPSGSVCTFAETLTTQPGDFADPSYVWSGAGAFAPPTVTIGQEATATVTLTNTYVREFGSLTIAKVVRGDGYTGGANPNFTVNYDCGPGFSGAVNDRRRSSATAPGPARRSELSSRKRRPIAGLLQPAFVWGTPRPGAGHRRRGSRQRRGHAHREQPHDADLRSGTGHQGGSVRRRASPPGLLPPVADCGLGAPFTFDLRRGPPGRRGTSPCPAPRAPSPRPAGRWAGRRLVRRGTTPEPQTVTLTSSGQVVAVTMTNTSCESSAPRP